MPPSHSSFALGGRALFWPTARTAGTPSRRKSRRPRTGARRAGCRRGLRWTGLRGKCALRIRFRRRRCDIGAKAGRSGCARAREPQARPPDVNLVARAQALAAPVAGGDFDGPAFAEDARSEFAFVVADAVLARRPIEADVRVRAGDCRVCVVAAFFKDHVIAAHDALL